MGELHARQTACQGLSSKPKKKKKKSFFLFQLKMRNCDRNKPQKQNKRQGAWFQKPKKTVQNKTRPNLSPQKSSGVGLEVDSI